MVAGVAAFGRNSGHQREKDRDRAAAAAQLGGWNDVSQGDTNQPRSVQLDDRRPGHLPVPAPGGVENRVTQTAPFDEDDE
jgi:hypothetical protein